MTTTEDKTAKRPHQAFLTLHEPKTGLEESFVFNVKESGKAKVELVCHDFARHTILAKQLTRVTVAKGSPLPIPQRRHPSPGQTPDRLFWLF